MRVDQPVGVKMTYGGSTLIAAIAIHMSLAPKRSIPVTAYRIENVKNDGTWVIDINARHIHTVDRIQMFSNGLDW